jgi:1-acyl-sn-glycerol-3-phosphate acyltransferase
MAGMPSSEESRVRAWLRRSLTIPVALLLWAAATALSPLAFAVLATVDRIRDRKGRPRWAGTRLAAALLVYLWMEALVLPLLLGLWIGSGFGVARRRQERWARQLQLVWGRILYEIARRLWRLQLDVDSVEEAAPGPVIVLIRHASMLDTVLPLVTIGSNLVIRYVLKAEMLLDPAFDIVGNWSANRFVRRGVGLAEREAVRVSELARDLGPRDAVLIFPEGTRFSGAKRQRILEKLADEDPLRYARAEGLKHLLLPRARGVLGLLEAAPEADVVFCGHAGLDGMVGYSAAWSGALIGRRIRVRFRRVRRADIPTSAAQRETWLYDQWELLDRWIDVSSSD